MQRLKRLLLIVTNAAVVVGLVIVSLELRQQRTAIESEYNLAIADVMSDNAMAVATGQGLADALAKGSSGGMESLDAGERVRVLSWFRAEMEPRISLYWMKDLGVVPA